SVPFIVKLLHDRTVTKDIVSQRTLSGKLTPFAASATLVLIAFFTFSSTDGTMAYIHNYLIHGGRHISVAAVEAIESDQNNRSAKNPHITEVVNVDNLGETYYLSVLGRTMSRFNSCLGVSENLLLHNADDKISTDPCRQTKDLKLIVIN